MITATVPVPRDANGALIPDPFVSSPTVLVLESDGIAVHFNDADEPTAFKGSYAPADVALEVQGEGRLAKRYTYAQLKVLLFDD